ncbi:6-phospho-3-hexuloisomerase [Candidatus Bathyarchaeota archaeon]|nr:6-phospho-3-hexuloisomerase [Candidatus Bathyarchaeota archaeon]
MGGRRTELLAFREAYEEILEGVRDALSSIDEKQVERMIDLLLDSYGRRILVMGVGRSGLVGKSFAMRLMHLGFNVYVLGETITPAIGEGDLIISISGSGSTKLVVTASEIAKDVGAKIIAITSYPDSELGRISDHVVQIKGRTKIAKETDYFLRQITGIHEPLAPLGTMFEASSMIFLDSLIAELMVRMGKTEEDMRNRHATIE